MNGAYLFPTNNSSISGPTLICSSDYYEIENLPNGANVKWHTQLLKTKQTGLRGQSAKIQTAGWKEGVYLVRVNYNDEVLTGKLLVKR